MDYGISGKTAAVAAASTGLGLATARSLASAGVRVAICSREQGRVDAAVAAIGHGAIGFVCDVSTAAGGRQFVEQAISELGSVDILIANGGGPPAGTFASTPEDEYIGALEKIYCLWWQCAMPPCQQCANANGDALLLSPQWPCVSRFPV